MLYSLECCFKSGGAIFKHMVGQPLFEIHASPFWYTDVPLGDACLFVVCFLLFKVSASALTNDYIAVNSHPC